VRIAIPDFKAPKNKRFEDVPEGWFGAVGVLAEVYRGKRFIEMLVLPRYELCAPGGT
jgi:hypothetical protein